MNITAGLDCRSNSRGGGVVLFVAAGGDIGAHKKRTIRMPVVSVSHYQSTLDAVYVYVVPWSEFPIVTSYPHYPHTSLWKGTSQGWGIGSRVYCRRSCQRQKSRSIVFVTWIIPGMNSRLKRKGCRAPGADGADVQQPGVPPAAGGAPPEGSPRPPEGPRHPRRAPGGMSSFFFFIPLTPSVE